MNICLIPMTRDLMHTFFQNLAYDPCTFETQAAFQEYVYEKEWVDAYFDKHIRQGKVHFAIIHGGSLIGDIYFKHISEASKSCELSIYLVNDSVKNKGYGTFAEILALNHAFSVMKMETVTASALIQNTRSWRALEKAGFRRIETDSVCHYYRCSSKEWSGKFGNT